MSRARNVVRSLVLVLSVALPALAAAGTSGYYRYPDLHGDTLVFCAEGDLWSVPVSGGAARRLTTYPGTEMFPRFSPDGRQIAFTGEYDGNRDVYVIPAGGGEPRRLTWHPGADEVVGWTPDGRDVLFRSRRDNPLGTELFRIPASGGDAVKLPIGWAARLAIDPATGTWAFNRKSWETATWKRYRGGTAPDIWVGHPDRNDFRPVTTFAGSNAFPMWAGGRIWFLSDQGGTSNIWSMKPDGSDRRRHTGYTDWDARWPNMSDDGRIAFVLGADVHVFDTRTGREEKVAIELPSERALTRTRYPNPGRFVSSFALSPKGDRVAVVTRGEIFSVAVKDGVTLPVTRGSAARENFASYSPDGKRLVYTTDATREEEIRTIDAWGRGEPKVVKPAAASGWHFPPAWSPDGKRIAYADAAHGLYVMPAEGGAAVAVDGSTQAALRDFTWSPDGRWIAYSKAAVTDYSSIWLYDTKTGRKTRVTGPYTNDVAPAWDPDGRYLYFLSDRATNPVLDTRDLQNVEIRNMQAFLVLLRNDVKNPFANLNGMPEDVKADAPKAAAGDPKKKDDAKKADDAKKPDEAPKPVEIDLEGIASRVVALPNLDRGLYGAIAATAKHVYLLTVPVKGMAEQPGFFEEPEPDNAIVAYDLEKKKAKPFADGVSNFVLATGAPKMALMKKRGEIHVVDATGGPADLSDSRVPLDNVVVELDPRTEWQQIYFDCWRQMRDFFWDPGMGGLDWQAVRDRYATLLPRIGTRDELRDLVGELIGELNNSHTYIFGGDQAVDVPRVSTGLLGADVVKEGAAYRVTRIYRGDPADNVRSALDEPGVGVGEGQYVLAVNHAPFRDGEPFYARFEKLGGKDAVLTVGAKPTMDGARDVVVTLLPDDSDLRYTDWVRRNREYVAQKTNGRIGYLHIPDMGAEGLVRFNTWFYPQLDKEGLIVDARWNGGGFVSQMIVERLRRHLVSFDRGRHGTVNTYPVRVLNGPFVVLTNEFAGSDGDIFPAAIQAEKLAPVIGMRSWGGVVGISSIRPLVDMGLVTQPETAWWSPKEGWNIENKGVVPDVEVQNLPHDIARGLDAQLDRGIAEVLRLRDLNPPVVPKWGPVRERTRKAFAGELEAAPGPAGAASSAPAASSSGTLEH